jgi:hypothetical protein
LRRNTSYIGIYRQYIGSGDIAGLSIAWFG